MRFQSASFFMIIYFFHFNGDPCHRQQEADSASTVQRHITMRSSAVQRAEEEEEEEEEVTLQKTTKPVANACATKKLSCRPQIKVTRVPISCAHKLTH